MDYDADGDLDILSGSYTGELYYFEKLASGEYQQGRFLTNAAGDPLNAGTSVVPEAVDMDADGDLDLVIGTRSSGVFMIENKGTRAQPVWAEERVKVKTISGKHLQGSNAHHADWDGDKVRDLIVGSEGGQVSWYRNVGSNDKPSYEDVLVLVPRGKGGQHEAGTPPTGPGSRTKVFVTDYNSDGVADLLVGDVQWHVRHLTPLTPEEEKEKAKAVAAYEKANEPYRKAVNERNSYVGKEGGIPQDVLDRMDEAYELVRPYIKKLATFDRTESETHGFVWLYLGGAKETAPQAESVQSTTASNGPVSFVVAAEPVVGTPGRFRLKAMLKVNAGWHLYADTSGSPQYVATSFQSDWPKGVEEVSAWSSKTEVVPDPKNQGVEQYVGDVVFESEIDANGVKGATVEVRYQACTETMCMVPTTLSVDLQFAKKSE